MLKKLLNIKKEINKNSEIILKKQESIELKKNNLKGEIDRWGKKQQKKNFP